ncbi:MAG: hypothetical protein GF331_07295 [Chitinivibrionales bacterium]|nr:hypothetical protein [Chitinivibrionales bacterium]
MVAFRRFGCVAARMTATMLLLMTANAYSAGDFPFDTTVVPGGYMEIARLGISVYYDRRETALCPVYDFTGRILETFRYIDEPGSGVVFCEPGSCDIVTGTACCPPDTLCDERSVQLRHETAFYRLFLDEDTLSLRIIDAEWDTAAHRPCCRTRPPYRKRSCARWRHSCAMSPTCARSHTSWESRK